MGLFKQEHEKGILIETWEFPDCPFLQFKLRYYEDKFSLWRYVPKQDEWVKEIFIEVFLIETSPIEWAEKCIEHYRSKND